LKTVLKGSFLYLRGPAVETLLKPDRGSSGEPMIEKSRECVCV
jgi:hypothetical protein